MIGPEFINEPKFADENYKQSTPIFITIKLTKEQVRKLMKKKEITIAQFKFIIDD